MAALLTGKVAVVTGGATGIGKAVAALLVASGANVVIAGRNQERGDAAVKALAGPGRQVRFVATDVGRETEVRALMEQTVGMFGGIDLLFNNAGIEGTLGPIGMTTEETVEAVLAINIKGVFLCMKHVVPRMVERGGGVIVNTASFVGTVVPFPNAVVYGASKAAVLSMTSSVAAGFGTQNVRVYAVCPWMTDTPMVDRLTGNQAQAKAQFGGINPSGKIATPDDIAGVAFAMLTGKAGVSNGDAVLVDSGGAVQKVHPFSATAPAPAQR